MSPPAGRVEEIRIYPVKSLGGRSLPSTAVEASGLVGDRAYAVVGETGAVLRGKDLPALRDLPATGDPETDAAAVAAAVGSPVRLEPVADRQGAAAVHLVSRQALDRAAAGEVPEGCTAEDPRANLVLTLDDGEDERSWPGRRVRIGTAVLQATRRPKHCLGVYADVVEPGIVSVGDPVQVDDAGPAGLPRLAR
ncbi:MAG TPA: MOSC N-terminal beta barrel domain-containing protein [Geodermatophilus sp.]|nr:MOSC N-terminal beta barrel domain-containing protein [Geodermatophilus sp.]